MNANSLAKQWDAPTIDRVAAPLREQVVESLRQAILDRRLQPGQRLIERELIEQFNVSRTTVREAIRYLNAQGLVTVVPQKGAVVSSSPLDDALDYYEVRAQVEAILVKRFTERASDEEMDALAEAVDSVRSEAAAGSVGDIMRAKDEFYEVLFAGSRGSAMKQVLESIRDRVQFLRRQSLSVPGRPQHMVNELQAVLDAARRRDADKAGALMAAHVHSAAEAALGPQNG